MRRGLTVTLLTVAIAILGSNAMSMAPTISDLPDLIVADDAPVSGGNHFVYPDTLNLHSNVTDDTTPDNQLVWTYFESTGKYRVNDADSLTGDGVSPAAAEIIAGPGATTAGDPDDGDADLATPTFRNNDLSPIGGPDVDPPGSGIIASETAALTFFVSDGDLTDSDTIIVFTDDDGGPDRTSPSGSIPVGEFPFSVSGTALGWVFGGQTGGAASSSSNSGICIDVPAAGENGGTWSSPYGAEAMTQIVDNTGMEFRFEMGTNQTTQGNIPLWDFFILNAPIAPGDPGIGANAYGADFWFLDNIGGSQGIDMPNGRSEFKAYFTPAAAQLASWRDTTTGAYQAAADPFNDMSFNFRVLDNTSGNYGAQNDSGSVCLENVWVGRFPLDGIVRGTVVYSDSDLQSGDWRLQGSGSTISFSGGNMTVAPASGTAWNDPGVDGLLPGPGTLTEPINDPASWPIAWEADKLLLYEVQISAPDAAAQQNPADVFRPMIDAGGSETFQESFLLPWVKFLGAGSAGAGAPPVGTPGTYLAFAYTNAASVASDYAFLRPRFDVMNFDHLNTPVANPTGAFTIHSFTVTEITLQ
jgi:hypothetical protein